MTNQYDVIIIGGGLAGLTLAIQCAKYGMSTIVIEKSSYPKHKVCGEYISKESERFLKSLGVPLDEWQLPIIDTFTLTSPYGHASTCDLVPGGIGISRYKLDDYLCQLARYHGAVVLEHQRVISTYQNKVTTHTGLSYTGHLIVGAYGRISGLQDPDTPSQKEKYIGVKYHVDEGPEKNKIEIHHFQGGYCGISAIEEDKYCMCYLAKVSSLNQSKTNIDDYEKNVLMKNPFLAQRFKANRLINRVVTSQLVFGVSREENFAVIGDAAGFIPPVTGNGMSLAFRASKLTFDNIQKYYDNPDHLISKINSYKHSYLKSRIYKGIFLQNLLLIENKLFNKSLMIALNNIPGLLPIMAKQAVGKEF
jgi:menaquinone-9 beta-reductase